jgi:hypothetical protein
MTLLNGSLHRDVDVAYWRRTKLSIGGTIKPQPNRRFFS